MNARISGLLSVALLVALGCATDPTDSLRGGVTNFAVNPNPLFVNEGGEVKGITVTPRDDQLNPISADYTVSSGSTAIATVAEDFTVPDPTGRTRRFNVTGVAPGQTLVTVSAGAVTARDTINVMPLAFGGAISSATPRIGDAITIGSTAVLKFNAATASVTFGAGGAGIVTAATVDQITVLVPRGAAGNPTIGGVSVTYVPGLVTSLPAASTVTQTGDRWAGNNAYATAPDITSELPAAAGQSTRVLTTIPSGNGTQCPEVVQGFGSTGGCAILKFTLTGAMRLVFVADWNSSADVDIYTCSASGPAACDFEDGGSGATGAQPEDTNPFTFPAGTHYFVIENYGGTSPTNVYVTITRS